MAHTGARPNEVAGLRKLDVRQEASIDYIHIRENHAEKTVKGSKGEDNDRKVPLHKHIAAEFAAYAKSRQTDAIFGTCEWSEANGRAGWLISNLPGFLRKHAAEIGVGLAEGIDAKTRKPVKKPVDADGQELSLHRIRASFQVAAELAGVTEKELDDIVGHEGKTTRDEFYRKRLPVPVLKTAIDKVKPLA